MLFHFAHRFRHLSLILLILLSVINPALARPLPNVHPRAIVKLTQEQVDSFAETFAKGRENKGVLYVRSGIELADQFLDHNEKNGYYGFRQFFRGIKQEYKNEGEVMPDFEQFSQALAKNMRGNIRLYGANNYKERAKDSFLTLHEMPIIHDLMKQKLIGLVEHMDATGKKVIGTEDSEGVIHYNEGYGPEYDNSTPQQGNKCHGKRDTACTRKPTRKGNGASNGKGNGRGKGKANGNARGNGNGNASGNGSGNGKGNGKGKGKGKSNIGRGSNGGGGSGGLPPGGGK